MFSWQAESGGSGIVTRRIPGQAGADEFVMKVPNNKVGRRSCCLRRHLCMIVFLICFRWDGLSLVSLGWSCYW